MKTPAFWSHPHILSTLLLPLAYVYDMAGTLLRQYRRPARLPVPVICIGNLTLGGAGKTPVAIAIGEMLKDKKVKAFYLSRGYGGKARGPLLVNPNAHRAGDVGDEPLLLARTLPTVVSKDRLQGALYAIQKGADVIVMDDGFQNYALYKALSLVVVGGTIGFGNGRLFPAGPLREDPALAWKRTHAVVVVNKSTRTPELPADKPILLARTQAKDDALTLKNKKLVAFCGLAYPQKFYDSLAARGAILVGNVSFADHHLYTEADMRKLLARLRGHDAALITTAKDAVRIPDKYRDCVAVTDIRAVFENEALVHNILDYILATYGKNETSR